MRKLFYLSTCDTCKKIIKEINTSEVELQDIKANHITKRELEQVEKILPGYENLFNKRARKYKEQKLSEKELSQSELKELILKEYTFLKRPLLIYDNIVIAGNSKDSKHKLQNLLNE
jgi:arsenate reductase (glutaredoxin)